MTAGEPEGRPLARGFVFAFLYARCQTVAPRADMHKGKEKSNREHNHQLTQLLHADDNGVDVGRVTSAGACANIACQQRLHIAWVL